MDQWFEKWKKIQSRDEENKLTLLANDMYDNLNTTNEDFSYP